MPELPEVETVRAGLARLLPGKTVASVSYDWEKSFPNPPADVDEFLVGAKITDVRRRAKVLMIDLDTAYTLVIHLKMTGQLVFVPKNLNKELRITNKGKLERNSSFIIPDSTAEGRFGAGHPNDSLIGELPDKSTRVHFVFTDQSQLFFNDFRKFGWIKLYPTVEVPNIDFMQKVGPEPLADDFTPRQFAERLSRRKNSNIKAVLLDQTIIAGVGNIYADESLWGAKIHPTQLVKSLSTRHMSTLYKELRYVLALAIEKGGSTDRNYVNAEGKKGSYMDFARVFRRENLPCPRCQTTIIKTRVAGRGTHLCPACQKEPK